MRAAKGLLVIYEGLLRNLTRSAAPPEVMTVEDRGHRDVSRSLPPPTAPMSTAIARSS